MRQLFALSGLLVSLLGSADAQTIAVRSGEHGPFTRLVTDFPAGTDFELLRDGRSVTIAAERGVSFAMEGVFARIDRSRIAGVRSDEPGRLDVELACDCRIESLQEPNGWVILDVFDAAVASKPERVVDTDDLLFQTLTEPYRIGDNTGVFTGDDRGPSESDAAQALLAERSQEARATLSKQFARAASQGLVRASAMPVAEADTQSQPPISDVSAPLESFASSAYPNLRIQTQIDRDTGREGRTIGQDIVCLPADSFDFASWGDPERPIDGVSRRRADLYDAAGAADPGATAEYARALIYATFFDEASAVLRDGPGNIPDRALLASISEALNGVSRATGLSDQIECDTNAAIVAFVAKDGPVMSDPNVVLRRLADLPNPLRDFLAPRIAERFLDFGLTEEAKMARNGYERSGAPLTAEAQFVTARLDQSNETEARALTEIVADRAPRAAEAMTFLLTSQMSRGEMPPLPIIEQASALSFEISDPDRERLERTIVQALATRGDFAGAFRDADRLARRGGANVEVLEAELFEGIAATELDASFLERMVPLVERSIRDDAMRFRIAERLFELGLPAQAERVIDVSGKIPTRDERLLRAAIATQAGKPEIARSYLAGLDGDDVAALRLRLGSGPEARPDPPENTNPPRLEVRAEFDRASASLSKSAALREEFSAYLGDQN